MAGFHVKCNPGAMFNAFFAITISNNNLCTKVLGDYEKS